MTSYSIELHIKNSSDYTHIQVLEHKAVYLFRIVEKLYLRSATCSIHLGVRLQRTLTLVRVQFGQLSRHADLLCWGVQQTLPAVLAAFASSSRQTAADGLSRPNAENQAREEFLKRSS
eukprot:g19545.t1